MKYQIDIECDNDDAMRRLALMQMRASGYEPVFRYAREMLRKANAENFTTGGLPVGGWRPRTRTYPWPLMIKTGKLMRSLEGLFGPPNNIGAKSAEFGTRVEYAKFHQYGTTRMPKRQIVFAPRGFARDLASKAASYVANGATP